MLLRQEQGQRHGQGHGHGHGVSGSQTHNICFGHWLGCVELLCGSFALSSPPPHIPPHTHTGPHCTMLHALAACCCLAMVLFHFILTNSLFVVASACSTRLPTPHPCPLPPCLAGCVCQSACCICLPPMTHVCSSPATCHLPPASSTTFLAILYTWLLVGAQISKPLTGICIVRTQLALKTSLCENNPLQMPTNQRNIHAHTHKHNGINRRVNWHWPVGSWAKQWRGTLTYWTRTELHFSDIG